MRALLPALLIGAIWSSPAQAEEPHIFRGKTVEGWLAILRDPNDTETHCREAATMLGCFGPEARSAAPDLIEAIREGQCRDEAVDALVNIGAGADVIVPLLIDRFRKRGSQHLIGQGAFSYDNSVDKALARVGEPAVPALLKILNGPDEGMRVCAAYALGEIGPTARAAVPALIRVVERADPEQYPDVLVRHAVGAIGRIGPEARSAVPALNAWLEKLRFRDLDTVIALDRIGAPPVWKLLDAFLRDGDPTIADLLVWLGPKAHEAAPSLRAALTDKRLAVRLSAAIALVHIDPSATEVVPFLIEGLKHQDDQDLEVYGSADALALLGPRAKAALPELIGLVNKGSADNGVVKGLAQIDPEGKECVPALIAAMKYDDYELVDFTAKCLSLLGPRAKDAIPVLRETLTRDFTESFSNGYNPQSSAARALRRVDPEGNASIPALTHALFYRHVVAGVEGESVDSEVAVAAAEVLGSYGVRAKNAIPVLIDVVWPQEENVDWGVRQTAAMALAQIGPDARVAIPVLREYLEENEDHPWSQAGAVVALYHLAPDGKEIAERWLARMPTSGRGGAPDPESSIRAMVLGAMGRTSFGCDWLTRKELESLEYALIHGHPADGDPLDHGEWRFERIGRLGTSARLAIPLLKELCSYPNPFVRMWAAEALERITQHQ